ncbi:hypothetical protein LRP88_01565 [Fusarium phalaenopsidis]
MSLIPLVDGTIGVYTHDIDPDPHIWDNFDPSIPFETSGSSEDGGGEEEEEKKKQRGALGVAAASLFSVAAGAFTVCAERTWLARILDIERTMMRNRARKAGIPRARL